MDFLGQVRPTTTDPVTLYSPPNNATAVVRSVYVCNTTAIAATYRIFYAPEGGIANESTAIAWDKSLSANNLDTDTFKDIHLAFDREGTGNLFVQSGTGNALTFTAIGKENGPGSFLENFCNCG